MDATHGRQVVSPQTALRIDFWISMWARRDKLDRGQFRFFDDCLGGAWLQRPTAPTVFGDGFRLHRGLVGWSRHGLAQKLGGYRISIPVEQNHDLDEQDCGEDEKAPKVELCYRRPGGG